MANRVEDLKVWQRAQEFWVAVNAIINRSGFQRDRGLRDQVKDAADSIKYLVKSDRKDRRLGPVQRPRRE
jgi:hypothetical protein